MALFAKSFSVLYNKPKRLKIFERLNMMGVECYLVARTQTSLARIVISFKHSFTPLTHLWRVAVCFIALFPFFLIGVP